MTTKETKKWLDALARAIVFTRDNFSCQIRRSKECTGSADHPHHIVTGRHNDMVWNTLNMMTTCWNCHVWVHNNGKEFREWFDTNYYDRLSAIAVIHCGTWHAEDYKVWETHLLELARKLNIDYLSLPPKYRAKFRKAVA